MNEIIFSKAVLQWLLKRLLQSICEACAGLRAACFDDQTFLRMSLQNMAVLMLFRTFNFQFVMFEMILKFCFFCFCFSRGGESLPYYTAFVVSVHFACPRLLRETP